MEKEFTTKSGFTFKVNPDFLDDADILELLIDAQDGNSLSLVKVYMKALGQEQYKKAKDFLREEDGRCRSSKLLPLLEECFEAIGNEAKNS